MRIYSPSFHTVFINSPGAATEPAVLFSTLFGTGTVPAVTTRANAAVSVTTASTLIRAVRQTRPLRLGLLLTNNDASKTLFYGQLAAMTTSIGTPLVAGAQVCIDGKYNGPVYGIAETGTIDVRVWEILRN